MIHLRNLKRFLAGVLALGMCMAIFFGINPLFVVGGAVMLYAATSRLLSTRRNGHGAVKERKAPLGNPVLLSNIYGTMRTPTRMNAAAYQSGQRAARDGPGGTGYCHHGKNRGSGAYWANDQGKFGLLNVMRSDVNSGSGVGRAVCATT